jgi:hypothetical protein
MVRTPSHHNQGPYLLGKPGKYTGSIFTWSGQSQPRKSSLGHTRGDLLSMETNQIGVIPSQSQQMTSAARHTREVIIHGDFIVFALLLYQTHHSKRPLQLGTIRWVIIGESTYMGGTPCQSQPILSAVKYFIS